MMPITLPLTIDVLDYIFSFLESDLKALKACCRSHPLLCQIAEPHIYANIYLKTSNYISDRNFGPSNLVKLLSNRPHIANYIRNLDIQVSCDSDNDVVPLLHEISTVLPKLLALKKITLDHGSTHWHRSFFCWESQPESFRMAFLGCLLSQDVQHICLRGIFYFPFISVWNGTSPTIKSNCVAWHEPLHRAPTSYNSNPPIKSLTVQCCGGDFLEKISGLVKTYRMHFRSLEYSHDSYDSLPGLLSCSSNFLTSLDLDIGEKFRTFYDPDTPTSTIPDPNDIIPIKLSTLPYLEQITIHSQLRYNVRYEASGRCGYFSSIPAITHLLSTRTAASDTSSLRRVTLDFDVACIWGPTFHSFPEAICPPFVHLLSKVAESSGASSAPTRVYLCLNGKGPSPTPGAHTQKPILLQVILSSFAVCGELMQFVHQGTLVVTPPIPSQNALLPVDSPLTVNPSDSEFSPLNSGTDVHNVSNSESRKLFTMLRFKEN